MNFNCLILLFYAIVFQTLPCSESHKCLCRIQCGCPQRRIKNNCKESTKSEKNTPTQGSITETSTKNYQQLTPETSTIHETSTKNYQQLTPETSTIHEKSTKNYQQLTPETSTIHETSTKNYQRSKHSSIIQTSTSKMQSTFFLKTKKLQRMTTIPSIFSTTTRNACIEIDRGIEKY